MTDSLGQSQVIPYLIGLRKKGHQITILSTEKSDNFKAKKEQIHNTLEENSIDWKHIFYTKKPPIFSTIKDVKALFSIASSLHHKKAFDIIHCRSYISAIIGLKMKKKFSTKFIFDMRGFWADERVDGKIWNLKNPVYKLVYNFFKRKEIQFLENADAIISLTNNASNKILQWRHIKNQPIPITVIPCCVDTERFNPDNINIEQKEKLKQQLGIAEDDFVITYLGSIGTWYMLDEMLDFFKQFILKKPKTKFLFITGEKPEFILTKAREKGIDSQYFIITRTDYTQVPLYLSLSNFSLFFILPVFSKSASSPIKQGEIMSMGIPIVCNTSVGDTDFVLKKYDCGVLVNSFNEKEYHIAIDKILNTKFDKGTIRNAAKDFYSLEKGIENYNKSYSKVLEI